MQLIPLLVFIFGLIIGSFLNVVILRLNTGRSIAKGRSKCARCSVPLAWYELIPVFSFLGLRGKCGTCKTRISFQYPVIELVTAIVFTILYTKLVIAGTFALFAWLTFIFALIIASLLIVIFVYDIKHTIIPDVMVYSFIGLSLVSIVYKVCTIPGFQPGAALISGVVVALPFFLLWALSKGRLMGFGDVKFALGMGWLLGFEGGITALVLSFWFGGVVGLFLLAVSHKYHMRSEIAFAPFLIAATFVVGVWGVTLGSLFQLWQ